MPCALQGPVLKFTPRWHRGRPGEAAWGLPGPASTCLPLSCPACAPRGPSGRWAARHWQGTESLASWKPGPGASLAFWPLLLSRKGPTVISSTAACPQMSNVPYGNLNLYPEDAGVLTRVRAAHTHSVHGGPSLTQHLRHQTPWKACRLPALRQPPAHLPGPRARFIGIFILSDPRAATSCPAGPPRARKGALRARRDICLGGSLLGRFSWQPPRRHQPVGGSADDGLSPHPVLRAAISF